jgi:transposase InsO family protein
MVERLHGTIRQRNKVMRGLDDMETAQTMMDGKRAYYNFLRPHMALNGKTPSEVSKIAEPNERTWKSLIQKSAKHARKL